MKLSRSVNKVLQEADAELAILVTRTRKIRDLTTKLRTLLEPDLAPHCYIGNIEQEKLTVIADSAAWASKFRFCSQAILPALNALHPAFSGIKSIHVKVLQQGYEPEPPPVHRPELNQENAQGLLTLAENVEDSDLQQALTRLAGRHKQKDPAS